MKKYLLIIFILLISNMKVFSEEEKIVENSRIDNITEESEKRDKIESTTKSAFELEMEKESKNKKYEVLGLDEEAVKDRGIIYSVDMAKTFYLSNEIRRVTGGTISRKKEFENGKKIVEVGINISMGEFDKEFRDKNNLTRYCAVFGAEMKEKKSVLEIVKNVKLNCGAGIGLNYMKLYYNNNKPYDLNKGVFQDGNTGYARIMGIIGIDYRKKYGWYVNIEGYPEIMLMETGIGAKNKMFNNKIGIGYKCEMGYYFF